VSYRIGKVAAAAAAVILSMLAMPATPSNASTYYEYWSYWHKQPGATSWQYSSVGSSGYYVQKGTQVEGWRFALGTASPSDPKPRPTNVSYDQYCSGKDTDKAYRVLLVVDYGTSSSAPGGPVYSCYGFDDSVTGYRVLTQQHSERDSGGLICAIDGYPHSGCGETTSSAAPKHSAKPAPKPRATTQTVRTTTPPPVPSPTATHQGAATVKVTAPPSAASPLPTGSPSSAPTNTPTLRPFTGAPAAESNSSFPLGVVVAVAGLIALGGGAIWLRRRSP
jgi:hypothetical protein